MKLENAHLLQTITNKTAKSGIFGAVYNIRPSLGVYANASKSLAVAGRLTPTVDNEFPQPGVGTSQEAGLKFDLFRRRVSGSLAFYDNKSGNEAVNVPAAARDAVDPAGINGRNGGMGSVADVRSPGVELVLTAFQFTIQNLLDVQPVEATLAANGGISIINISEAPRTYLLSMRTRL